MNDIKDLAIAMLTADAVRLRQLVAEVMRQPEVLASVPLPVDMSPEEHAAAASILELLCERAGVEPPSWTEEAPSLSQPMFVVKHALRMPRLRELCLSEGPHALKRRGVLAPPDVLTSI